MIASDKANKKVGLCLSTVTINSTTEKVNKKPPNNLKLDASAINSVTQRAMLFKEFCSEKQIQLLFG